MSQPILNPIGLSILNSYTSSYSTVLPDSNLGTYKIVQLLNNVGKQITVHTSQGSFYLNQTDPNKELVFTQNPPWTIINNPTTSFFPTTIQAGPLLDSSGNAYGNYSICISADGNTVAVGTPIYNTNLGAIWIYTRLNGNWTPYSLNPLVGTGYGSPPRLGYSISISADGTMIAAGGPINTVGGTSNIGGTWIFNLIDDVWSQNPISPLIASGYSGSPLQGTSVSLSASGTVLAVGSPGDSANMGATWIFNSFTQVIKIVGTSGSAAQQGSSVALSGDGLTVAIGGPYYTSGTIQNAGGVWIYNNSTGTWTPYASNPIVGTPISAAEQGTSVALSYNGNRLSSGGPNQKSGITNVGAVWIFDLINGVWTQNSTTPLTGSYTNNSYQGYSTALSADGNTLISGGVYNYINRPPSQSSGVWCFTYSAGSWSSTGPPLFNSMNIRPTNQNTPVAISYDGSTVAASGSSVGTDIFV